MATQIISLFQHIHQLRDVGITQTLNDPQDVAPGATINYTVTYTNHGPDLIDLNDYRGSGNPLTTSLLMDILPPDLTFGTVLSNDALCNVAGLATIAGPLLAHHATYHVVICDYSGTGAILQAGQSFTITFSATVGATSSLSFSNYVLNFSTFNDPDGVALSTVFSSGNDLIDVLGNSINNVNGISFSPAAPTTTTTPVSTTVPQKVAGGSLPFHGFKFDIAHS